MYALFEFCKSAYPNEIFEYQQFFFHSGQKGKHVTKMFINQVLQTVIEPYTQQIYRYCQCFGKELTSM